MKRTEYSTNRPVFYIRTEDQHESRAQDGGAGGSSGGGHGGDRGRSGGGDSGGGVGGAVRVLHRRRAALVQPLRRRLGEDQHSLGQLPRPRPERDPVCRTGHHPDRHPERLPAHRRCLVHRRLLNTLTPAAGGPSDSGSRRGEIRP
ncbi:hypothetical protein F1734_25975 (plasmid) [Rhodococcus ruber]|nr:hypothetical protein F1734_25975 [Rhodococcus ruber]